MPSKKCSQCGKEAKLQDGYTLKRGKDVMFYDRLLCLSLAVDTMRRLKAQVERQEFKS